MGEETNRAHEILFYRGHALSLHDLSGVPIHHDSLEAYFAPQQHSIIPLEMKEQPTPTEAKWYALTHLRHDAGNISFDLRTPKGTLERACYRWFEQVRGLLHSAFHSAP